MQSGRGEGVDRPDGSVGAGFAHRGTTTYGGDGRGGGEGRAWGAPPRLEGPLYAAGDGRPSHAYGDDGRTSESGPRHYRDSGSGLGGVGDGASRGAPSVGPPSSGPGGPSFGATFGYGGIAAAPHGAKKRKSFLDVWSAVGSASSWENGLLVEQPKLVAWRIANSFNANELKGHIEDNRASMNALIESAICHKCAVLATSAGGSNQRAMLLELCVASARSWVSRAPGSFGRDSRGASNILYALAKIESDDLDVAWRVADEAVCLMSTMNAQEIANSLWALAAGHLDLFVF